METKVNKEYQKLIDFIDKIRFSGDVNNKGIISLGEVQDIVRNLGSRPMLTGNAQLFVDITGNMAKTYVAKNHDYGNSFEQSCDKFGIVAGIIRIGDKMNRLESLVTKEPKVKDESIKDTLLDMANYAVMTLIWINKQEQDKEV